MIKAYKYLFYRLYEWAASLPYDNTPGLTGILSISGLFFFNTIAILNILNSFGINSVMINNTHGILLIVLLAIVNYVIIYKKIGKESIINLFKNENEREKTTRSIYVGAYILGTAILYLISLSYIKITPE